jgi:organic hydroperoxide reductase OsmC/OhrA
MQPLPHQYSVTASMFPGSDVPISAEGLRVIETNAPKEFDGPGNQWSPEQLLTAAVADCFLLSFRAVATASKYKWLRVELRTEGKLDRIDGKTRFTHFTNHAKLHVPVGSDVERAKNLLEKAEAICIISNSLLSERHLESEVIIG